MRHGSLFSGIGGFDLAAEWMGWENVFHCEWMEFPRKVLDYYWPDADSHVDICKTDFTKYANTIDIISGGFPCQPFSLAGKRKGTSDERYLWGEMLRAICEIKPTWVIAENVFGITNIDGGLVFEQVCLDLETEGYEVQPFIIPACAKNAPHRRDRCWFVAFNTKSHRSATIGKVCTRQDNESIRICYDDRNATDTDSKRHTPCRKSTSIERNGCENNGKQKKWGEQTEWFNRLHGLSRNAPNTDSTPTKYKISTGRNLSTSKGNIRNATDTNGSGISRQQVNTKTSQRFGQMWQSFKKIGNAGHIGSWHNFPTESPICGGNDGLPTELDGITFSKWRNESIKGYGNAIVPQIAYQLFQIIEHESKNKNT